MAKVDDILSRCGDNMAESIGLRPQPVANDGKYSGIKLARDKGEVPIDMIVPDPDQPRKEFDGVPRLATSVRQVGILQPLRVRWSEELHKWKILTGERRWRAAKEAGLKTVPCSLLDRELTIDEVEAEQLIENFHRQDLSTVEMANAFRRRMDRRSINQKTLAGELGIDPGEVTRILAVLKLPEEVQAQVAAGEIDRTTAYHLSKLTDADDQKSMAAQAVAGKLPASTVKERVRAKTPEEDRRQGIRQPLTLTYRHDAGLKVTVRIEPGARRKLVENWQSLAEEIEADLRQKAGRRMAA